MKIEMPDSFEICHLSHQGIIIDIAVQTPEKDDHFFPLPNLPPLGLNAWAHFLYPKISEEVQPLTYEEKLAIRQRIMLENAMKVIDRKIAEEDSDTKNTV